jgi:iron complex transport system permease protein
MSTSATADLRLARLRLGWVVAGVAAVALALTISVAVGPVSIGVGSLAGELTRHLPIIGTGRGLTAQQATIVWELRLPRVVLALLVGAMLASAGATYQGVFRNPLADPYLLGAAAGAGLAVTFVLVAAPGLAGRGLSPLPIAAFGGALVAVLLAYALGRAAGGRSAATLLLAGVAVASFLTAVQTYVQQQHVDTIRQVYSWILGRLTTAGWSEVLLVLPYFLVTTAVLLAHRRVLDVLAVGDTEASTLGVPTARTRLVIVATASLATAAAVSVSGLIGFVGIIVPHTVRLVAGASYRVILPLSLLFGAAFLAFADLAARTLAAPSEIPIGVITAFVGAPFFVLVLRTSREAPA